eukprot:EG_transcript_60605
MNSMNSFFGNFHFLKISSRRFLHDRCNLIKSIGASLHICEILPVLGSRRLCVSLLPLCYPHQLGVLFQLQVYSFVDNIALLAKLFLMSIKLEHSLFGNVSP